MSQTPYQRSALSLYGNTTSAIENINTASDAIELSSELSHLQCKQIMQRQKCSSGILRDGSQSCYMEVDSEKYAAACSNYTLSYQEICSTALSILIRAATVCINVKLAVDYYAQGHRDYFIWTVVCIVTPMVVTMLIHGHMCYQDGKFSNGCAQSLRTALFVTISFLFRYCKSLLYAIKCKRAELMGDKPAQLKNYKLNIREESDIAFIRLFECFLEAAPQKILQISIVLGNTDKMSNWQICAIISYFGSMAWCLSVYHRYNRYSQSDKYNITTNGVVLQLCWHFCIAVSRTLCIAFIASIYPFWTVIACLAHALLFGLTTLIIDCPKFAKSLIGNFIFCLILGFIYIFTYISVRDAPTRYKYLLYYIFCSMENVICVSIFIFEAPHDLASNRYLFFPLCAMAIAFYYVGIVFMIIYYLYFHPRITARTNKQTISN